jgi:hypothetical protein
MYAPVFNQAAYNVATNTMDATEEVNGMPW